MGGLRLPLFAASLAGTRPFGSPRRPSGGRIRTRLAIASLATSLWVTSARASAAPEPAVKLAVLITVDQLGAVYLDRYGPALGGGVARLRRRGILLPNVVHATLNTETAPGHGTITTGAWPNVHGLVANYWYDASGKRTSVIADPDSGKGPRSLVMPGLSEALEVSTRGAARVVSIGIKDRAVITMAGESPALAIWYAPELGAFTSGTWYRARASGAGIAPEPAWIAEVAAPFGPKASFGRTWSRVDPRLDYDALAGPDDGAAEALVPGLGRTFPRVLGAGLPDADAEEWRQMYPTTPAAIEAVLALASRAIAEEKLGQRGTTDLLAIELSSLDYAGHYYGPDSHEALDILLRTDRALGAFLDQVDRLLGSRSVLWVVTGDHGIAPAPERSRAWGVRASRVDQRALIRALDEGLAQLSAERKDGARPAVEDVNAPRVQLRFSEEGKKPGAPAVDRTVYRRAVAAMLRARPEIVAAQAIEDLDQLSEPWRTLALRTVYPGRNPDVLFVHRPYDLFDPGAGTSAAGSGHGTPYHYDAAVPVLAAGPGVRRGEDRARYEMTRLAPAIAVLLGIEPPPAALEPPLPILENP